MSWLLPVVLCLVVACGSSAGIVATGTPSSSPAVVTPAGTPARPARQTPTPVPTSQRISLDDLHPLIDDVASGFMASEAIPGLAIAVVQKGPDGRFQTRYYNYGVASKETNQPVTEHSIFEIHSISKVFTSTLLGRAVVENKARLEDTVAAHIPDVTFPSFDGKQITLEELATHRSGLPRDYPGEGTARDTPAALLGYVSGYKLPRAPGSQYEYSNLAFGLLGLLDARLYNTNYADLLRQVITGPLGMPDTAIVLNDEQHRRKVQDYTAAGAPNAGRLEQDVGAAGAMSLHSTTVDLAKFLIANIAPETTPLGPFVTLAQKRYETRNNNGGGSGLGWEIENPGTPSEQLWKDGAGAGGTTYIWWSRATDTGIVVLTNKGVTNDANGIPSSPSAAIRVGNVLGAILSQPVEVSINAAHTTMNTIARQTLADGSRRFYLHITGGRTVDVPHLSTSDPATVFTTKPELLPGPPVWQVYPRDAILSVTFPPNTPSGSYDLTAKTGASTYSLTLSVASP